MITTAVMVSAVVAIATITAIAIIVLWLQKQSGLFYKTSKTVLLIFNNTYNKNNPDFYILMP